METAQKLIDFTNTYYFIKFWTKTTIFDVIRIIFSSPIFGFRDFGPSGFMHGSSMFMENQCIYI